MPMNTLRLAADPAGLAQAAELLLAGQLVAFPTETVYGLAAHAEREDAIAAIFRVKGRPRDKALLFHVSGISQARSYCRAWPAEAQRLAEQHWPGPLTLVVERSEHCSPTALAGGDTVALRCPDHPVAQALIQACGAALPAPSANLSGQPPPTDADAVLAQLDGRIAAVVDGGPCPLKVPSTLVSLVGKDAPRILRQGALQEADLQLRPTRG